jgi:hypothetical protein
MDQPWWNHAWVGVIAAAPVCWWLWRWMDPHGPHADRRNLLVGIIYVGIAVWMLYQMLGGR